MDKWYEKSGNRFSAAGYFDLIFLDKVSPYYCYTTSRDVGNNVVQTIMRTIAKLEPKPKQIAEFIFDFYQSYELNGQVFDGVQHPLRVLPVANAKKSSARHHKQSLVAKSVGILEKSPLLCKAIFDQIKSFPDDEIRFAILADVGSSVRNLNGKDSKFIQDKLVTLGYVGVTCSSKFEKHEKAFLEKDSKNILRKLGIEIYNKSPDWVVKNKDTIYIGEDKCQVEGGGSQLLSRKDGCSVFDHRNVSSYKTRMVFCFDGDYNLLGSPTSLITNDHKIMSIFDVVDYIESGE